MNEIEGITISAIGKNFIELTNGQTKFQSEEFNTDVYFFILSGAEAEISHSASL